MKRKVVIFSGAGISQESGIKTFRDSEEGLWEEYKIEDVATPQALKNNTQVFCDFYNKRKEEMKTVFPNQAHLIAKQLEEHFDVTIITQNVDNLHERAGSSKIYHLHGTLSKLRSSFDESYEIDYINDLKPGDLCPDKSQLRPAIVLFGESLPNYDYVHSVLAIAEADIVIIVGTSMRVFPAADLPWDSKEHTLTYYIGPDDVDFEIPEHKRICFTNIKEKASVGMEIVSKELVELFIN